jgi:F-type H+-transporting ATPase subunit a
VDEHAILFSIGPLEVTRTVVTTWGILAAIWLLCLSLGRRLRNDPGPLQTAVEGVVLAQEHAIAQLVPGERRRLLPFIGGLWVFLVAANLLGVVPGLSSPTADLSATVALALLVFVSTHWFGVRSQGLHSYLQHYLKPSPILLPFHVVGEITRIVALAVRLFGNMMSLEMAALLVLLVAGFLVPVPILALHIIEALVQAYIFGMLALIYVAGGIQAQQLKRREQQENQV